MMIQGEVVTRRGSFGFCVVVPASSHETYTRPSPPHTHSHGSTAHAFSSSVDDRSSIARPQEMAAPFQWPQSDTSVERQARYVTAVVSNAQRSDQKKLERILTEQAYLIELQQRTRAPPPTPPKNTYGDAAVDDAPLTHPMLQPAMRELWVADLASMLAWVRGMASTLAVADPCAPRVAPGMTDVEVAIELGAPQCMCQLAYSQEPGAGAQAGQAAHLVPRLQELLGDFEVRRRDAYQTLNQLAPLLRVLAVHGGAALARAAVLPSALALATLLLPDARRHRYTGNDEAEDADPDAAAAGLAIPCVGSTLRAELGRGGALGGKAYREAARRLLALLDRANTHQHLCFIQCPLRLRSDELVRISPRLRAALAAALAAAAALCEAVRRAEGSAACSPSSGHSEVSRAHRQAGKSASSASSWKEELDGHRVWSDDRDRDEGVSTLMEGLCRDGVDDPMGLSSPADLVNLLARRLHPPGLHALAVDAHNAAESVVTAIARREAAREAAALAAAFRAEAAEAAREGSAAGAPGGGSMSGEDIALAIFRRLDTDDSGSVDAAELRQALEASGKSLTDDEALRASMRALDANGDGVITIDELRAAPPEEMMECDPPSAYESLLMLRLALLASCQLSAALLAQALCGLLCARAREPAVAALPLSPEEMTELTYASAADVTPVASVAALMRQGSALRRCALEASDGPVRVLAARCDWAAQLALMAEPATELHLSLATASIGAALNLTVSMEERAQPLAELASRVQEAVLAATYPGRQLPPPRPRLGPAIADRDGVVPVSAHKPADVAAPPRSPPWRTQAHVRRVPSALLAAPSYQPPPPPPTSATKPAPTRAATVVDTMPSPWGAEAAADLLPFDLPIPGAGAPEVGDESSLRPPARHESTTSVVTTSGRALKSRSRSSLHAGTAPGGGWLESMPPDSPLRYSMSTKWSSLPSGRCCGGSRSSKLSRSDTSLGSSAEFGASGVPMSEPLIRVPSRPASAASLHPSSQAGMLGSGMCGGGAAADGTKMVRDAWHDARIGGSAHGGRAGVAQRPRSALAATSSSRALDYSSIARRQRPGSAATPLTRSASVGAVPVHTPPPPPPPTRSAATRAAAARTAKLRPAQDDVSVLGETAVMVPRHPAAVAAELELARKRATAVTTRAAMAMRLQQPPKAGGIMPTPSAGPVTLSLDLHPSISHARTLGGVATQPPSRPMSAGHPPWRQTSAGHPPSRPMSAGHPHSRPTSASQKAQAAP